MPVARSFHRIVRSRVRRDADFRRELLVCAIDALFHNECEVAHLLFEDYIAGAKYLGEFAQRNSGKIQDVANLFSTNLNPGGKKLTAAISDILEAEGLELKVHRRGQ